MKDNKKNNKKDNIWKRILTSKAVVVTVVIIGLIALFGFVVITMIRCGLETVKPTVTADPNMTPRPTPTASPMPDRDFDLEIAIDFDPDTSQMPLLFPHIANEREEFTAENWVDITPAEVRAAVDCIIIRHRDLGLTFLRYEDAYFNLDDDRNNIGVLDIVLCDLLESGSPQLVYTLSEGYSSDALTTVVLFDFETKERIFADFALMESSLALEENGENSLLVFRATRRSGQTWGGYLLLLGEPLGELTAVDGRIKIALY
ncbi:MAG: hypothetical protein FWE69_03235 [Clostridiales bacterium]|nr:hypothetical protein [Clostridiales bacterium]